MARNSTFLAFVTTFAISIMIGGCEIFTEDDVSPFDHPFTASFGGIEWEGEGTMRVVDAGTVRISGLRSEGTTTELVFVTIPDYRGIEYYQLSSDAGIAVRRNGVETVVAKILPSPSNSASVDFQNAEIARGSYSFIAQVVSPFDNLSTGDRIGVSGTFLVELPFRD